MVGVAQGMGTPVAVIRLPMIMAEHALEPRPMPMASIASVPRLSCGENQVNDVLEAQGSQWRLPSHY